MRKNGKWGETLCSNNLDVKTNLTMLRARLKKLGVSDPQVYELINDSRETLRIMKSQGQKIENRAYLYRTTIENVLGFKRVYKTKKSK